MDRAAPTPFPPTGRRSATAKLLAAHVDGGDPRPGDEIELRIDQTLTQDATGTLVLLEVEAMGVDRAAPEVAAQYVDHNLLQEDHKNQDDHLFLRSACRRFGLWFHPPGTGVSHPVHQQRFGRPGATLLGSDSHTCAAGSLGMLAIGAGGIDVALAIAGEPFRMRAPEVFGVHLKGVLPPWVSAKDVILEMLRRHGVDGALGCVVEYHGPGLASLSTMDRHVIANMGAELGATSTVFPSDRETRRFLSRHGREGAWVALEADAGARYERSDEIDLSTLEPLIALPSSPGNVVPVREVEGRPIHQAYVGSSANPGFRDFAIAAEIVRGRQVPPGVSFDVNPTSRELLRELIESGHLGALVAAGARLHQAGCNGCIGMGQAPGTGRISLRTVPRNFPGRSGTADDLVYLCSPETAAASALAGAIFDPRRLGERPPAIVEPELAPEVHAELGAPLPPDQAREVELEKGPNVKSLPRLTPLDEATNALVALKVGDDLSTDEILPAGARVLPYRSNVERIAEFAFEQVDASYVARARAALPEGGHVIVAGRNYGQGSSREHAALAPRTLGLRAVLAQGFARIHRRNLINFGVLPLLLADARDHERLAVGDRLRLPPASGLPDAGRAIVLRRDEPGAPPLRVTHDLSPRELTTLRAGGAIAERRRRGSGLGGM